MSATLKSYVVVPLTMKRGARLFLHPTGKAHSDLVCWYTKEEAERVADKFDGSVKHVKDGEVV